MLPVMTSQPRSPREIPFPDSAAVVAADAARYRALPSIERWRRLFALQAWGARQALARPAAEREPAAEVRWREIQKELFARHAR